MVGFGGMVGSGVMAGLVAVIVTVAIEKLGGLAGGIIATLPTTIVPASIGLYYQLSEPSDLAVRGLLADVAMLALTTVVPSLPCIQFQWRCWWTFSSCSAGVSCCLACHKTGHCLSKSPLWLPPLWLCGCCWLVSSP